MPIGLVAGFAGAVPRARAVQLFNQIPQAERGNWRIFYFDAHGAVHEYTSRTFNNVATVVIAAETHLFVFCHGYYNPARGNRSTALSIWDIDANHGTPDTQAYVNWLTHTGVGITTIIVAACHAGDVGAGGAGNIPIQDLVAVRAGINADGPNTSLNALGGVDVNWNPGGAPAHWTRF
jgi:hypothetical protein